VKTLQIVIKGEAWRSKRQNEPSVRIRESAVLGRGGIWENTVFAFAKNTRNEDAAVVEDMHGMGFC
jgi:hypothetical protein